MINFNKNKKLFAGLLVFFVTVFLFEIYIPKSFANKSKLVYELERGTGYKEVGDALEKRGIIKNSLLFQLYALISLNYSKLQAGKYELSQSMPIAEVIRKFSSGDVLKNKITVIEGWTIKDLAQYFEDKKIYHQKDFLNAAKNDFSKDFSFLKDKPQGLSLEGYIFPDTYYMTEKTLPEEFIKIALSNFYKKLKPELRQEIAKHKKSVFQVITMASMIEKEVKTSQDKKIVSGILWKRIKEGIPLQVDATVNYITGKNDLKISAKDTKIDSPYNTYKYYGFPLGPISNPGLDSILAAIYPKESDYWYYLSADGNGKTIFSKTLDEQNDAVAKYFKH